jgi:hypothetical protein
VSIFEQTSAAWLKAGTPTALIYNGITRIESAMGQ